MIVGEYVATVTIRFRVDEKYTHSRPFSETKKIFLNETGEALKNLIEEDLIVGMGTVEVKEQSAEIHLENEKERT